MSGGRIFRILPALAVVAAMAASAHAQSLGSVARKERERRAKNKNAGVETRVIPETEIFGDEPAEAGAADAAGEPGTGETIPSGDAGAEGPDDPGATDGSTSDRPHIPERIDVDVTGGSDEAEASGDRKAQEAEWRARLERARARIAEERERKRVLDEIRYVPGMTLYDENGEPVIASLAELRALVEDANRRLAAAEKALDDLLSEARRAGVPPGWLR